jgi:hypothetical protein
MFGNGARTIFLLACHLGSTLGSVQDSTLLREPPVKNPASAPPAAGFFLRHRVLDLKQCQPDILAEEAVGTEGDFLSEAIKGCLATVPKPDSSPPTFCHFESAIFVRAKGGSLCAADSAKSCCFHAWARFSSASWLRLRACLAEEDGKRENAVLDR